MGNRRRRRQRRLEQREARKWQRHPRSITDLEKEVNDRRKFLQQAIYGAIAIGSAAIFKNDNGTPKKRINQRNENILHSTRTYTSPRPTNSISIDPTDPDGPILKFREMPGVMKSLPPVRSCDGIDEVNFSRRSVFEKFARIIRGCEGNLQRGGNTWLKCTIPGYRINDKLFQVLERIIDMTGFSVNLPQAEVRNFIFHRKDGKDGIPLADRNNLKTSFTSQARTYMNRRGPLSFHTFTAIPLSGDKASDITSLAVEICQTRMVGERNDMKAEITCNAFNLAVRCAYLKIPYRKYIRLVYSTKAMLKDGGEKLKVPALNNRIYAMLQKELANQPDILIPKN